MLYYDPFASFAPTYDSTGATLTYSQTVATRLSRARLLQWEAEVTAPSDLATVLPALPPPKNARPLSKGEDVSLTGEDGGAGEGGAETERVTEEVELWRQLGENSVMIGQLVREQWARLKGSPEAEGEVVNIGQTPGAGVKVLKVAEREQATASTLLRSLTALVASRRVEPPPPGSRAVSLLPPAESLRASTPTLVAALRPAPPTFVGTLEPQNFRAIREGGLRRKGAVAGQGVGANGANGVNGGGQAGPGLVVPKMEE